MYLHRHTHISCTGFARRSSNFLLLLVGLCLGTYLTISSALASTSATATQQGRLKPLSLSGTLSTTLGTGSFAASSYKNHFVAQSLNLNVGYTFLNGKLSTSANWGFDFEYTQPDNAAGRAFLPRDTGLRLRWNNPIDAIAKVIGQSIGLNILLPTSLLSQVSTRLLQVELALGLRARVGIFSAAWTVGAARGFHRYTSPVFDQSKGDNPSILLRQSTRQTLDLPEGIVIMPGARNIAWQIRNMLVLGVRLHQTVSLSVAFAIFNAFKYPMPDDEFTPSIPTNSGDIKADTVGRMDFTLGNISLTWQPLRQLGVTLSAQSLQTPMNASNSGLRVPFVNLATPNDNTTTFSLAITGSY